MQKKIIALAVAAAFSAPAFADTANVNVYGKAFLTVDQTGSDAAGAISHLRVNTNASRFGVKATEELGDGLKGIFQYEVEMDGDGNGLSATSTSTSTTTVTPSAGTATAATTTTTTTTAGGLSKTRNSGVGLDSNYGKVMLGIWDSPFKVAHNKIELFDNTSSWTSTLVIGRSAGKDYNTRQKNMVQYWSPKFAGVQAAVMYGPDESKTATVNKGILSMSATYDQDGIYGAVAYESRNDATTTTKTDSAMRVVGKYDLADFSLGAMFESIKVNTNATTVTSGSNMEFVGQYKLGSSTIAASYAKAGSTAAAGAAANDVTQLSLKYAYNFSKRTEVFAAYASNKVNAATPVTKTYLGGGLIHSF